MTLQYVIKTFRLKPRAKFSKGKLRLTLSAEFGNINFVGVGPVSDAYQNCVEVFEIHQELWRKGLLTTKNMN